ncbi:hypothetical protein [Silanimonas sp.]|jgi:hypothetical protein|uniref:hypothetical protein n=1 Tax=Silanimonas sp. TaxID=1929290 RepID=UPI0037C921D4
MSATPFGVIGPEAVTIGLPIVGVMAVVALVLALRWAKKDPVTRRQRLQDFAFGALAYGLATTLAMELFFPTLQWLAAG